MTSQRRVGGHETFVSYATREPRERAWVVELIRRLDALGGKVWVFDRFGSEVPLGADADDYCRQQVAASRYFIGIVSASSVRSAYVESEVDAAIEHGLTMVPIRIVHPATETELPHAFARLLERAGFVISDLEAASELERVIEGLAQLMGLEYVAQAAHPPRLPVGRRLRKELERRRPRDENHYSDVRRRLLESAESLEASYSRALRGGTPWRQVLARAETLSADADDEFPGQPLYYTRVVVAILAGMTGDLAKCFGEFQRLCEHHEADENAFAGLAWAYLQHDRVEDALALYSRALEMQGGSDLDLVHNVLMCSLLLARPPPSLGVAIADPAASGAPLSSPAEHDRLLLLRKLYLAVQSDDRLEWLSASANSDLVLAAAQRQHAASKQRDDGGLLEAAVELLARHLPQSSGREWTEVQVRVAHAFTRYAFECNKAARALPVQRDLATAFPQNAQYQVEAAIMALRLGRISEARALAELAADLFALDLTSTPHGDPKNHLYYVGFASHLLGDAEGARMMFKLSGRAAEDSYENVLGACLCPRWPMLGGPPPDEQKPSVDVPRYSHPPTRKR